MTRVLCALMVGICLVPTVWLSPIDCLAQSTISDTKTPFEFVREKQVRQEIDASNQQMSQVASLEPQCNQICQQKIQQTFTTMDGGMLNEFEQLDTDNQFQVIKMLADDVRESTELELLESQVLSAPQMQRFRQLWVQDAGLDAFTMGASSRELGMTGDQINRINSIRNNAVQSATNIVQGNVLNNSQINIQVQNIQSTMINQCINVLTPQQRDKYMEMTGQSELQDTNQGEGTTEQVADSGTETQNALEVTTDTGQAQNSIPSQGSASRVQSFGRANQVSRSKNTTTSRVQRTRGRADNGRGSSTSTSSGRRSTRSTRSRSTSSTGAQNSNQTSTNATSDDRK